jgi:hypothetical protein
MKSAEVEVILAVEAREWDMSEEVTVAGESSVCGRRECPSPSRRPDWCHGLGVPRPPPGGYGELDVVFVLEGGT